jgi:hypothetical protein
MTLHSSGLFSFRTASGCIENGLVLPVSPFLPDEKTLVFVATIHFVRGSKPLSNQEYRFTLLTNRLLTAIIYVNSLRANRQNKR